ncbi:MAG: 16S rRNA (uracil(1498)-N(3))-methyltransferase [Lautropia sp.]
MTPRLYQPAVPDRGSTAGGSIAGRSTAGSSIAEGGTPGVDTTGGDAACGYAVGASIALDDGNRHHAGRVLRLAAGAVVELFDGAGHAALARLADGPGGRAGFAAIERLLPPEPEPPVRLTLAQAISAADRMDWTIEKAVELGVAAIVPLQSERGVVRLDRERSARRLAHWHRIIVAACAQCRRNRLPALAPVTTLNDWLAAALPAQRRWMLDPEADASLASLAANAGTDTEQALLCGPESGFSDAERRCAVAAGCRPARLGPRVLRTETAGVAALAVLQGLLGDLR